MKTRIKWIDQTRAIAMILIVFGHALGQTGGEGGTVYNWLYLFHVPLCVVLSGFLFTPRSTVTEAKRQIKKIVIHEYVPYLIWGIMSIAIYVVLITRNVFTGGGYAVGLLYGNGSLGRSSTSSGLMVWNSPLWYLPFIVTTEIIACVLSKLLNGFNKWIAFLLSIIMGYTSYRILNLHTLVFELETVIYLFPFFLLGVILKDADFPNSRKKLFASIGLITIGGVLGKVNGAPGYLSDIYNNYILFLGSAMGLCIGIILLIQCAEFRNCVLNYIGRNTLVILVAHKCPIMFCSIILSSILHVTFENQIVMIVAGVTIAIISLVACLLVGRIAEKICPVLIGKSPNS